MKTSFCMFAPALAAAIAACPADGAGAVEAADAPVRVLIFSGQNNHDWKTTTPKLREILVSSGRFTAEVTERPDRCTAGMLAAYDLILSDWNAWGDASVKAWPAAARAAFLDFVRSGKGYVSVHAGSSSFYDWPEYQQIGGLYWNLAATSHGAPHEFAVQFSGEHPVTKGLQPFRTRDELWLKPGIHPAAQVLATRWRWPRRSGRAADSPCCSAIPPISWVRPGPRSCCCEARNGPPRAK